MPNVSKIPLILASSSAARQSLLRNAGVNFAVIPADIDEAAVKAAATGTVEQLALALAAAKAARISVLQPRALVIGADQILVCEDQLFDKPATLEAAAGHLRALSGKPHQLITAACVYQAGKQLWHHIQSPRLQMRALSEDFIGAYLKAEGEAVCASVGAYRLEGPGLQLFEHIDGDFFTILGLPLLPLLGFLRSCGALGC